MKNIIITENTIKTFVKETLRYEILIEAYNRKNSMRFSVKSKSLIDSEFESAVSMCREENNKSFAPIYYSVKVIDRANLNIIKQINF